MFCQNCGSRLEDGDRFCPTCGTAVEDAPADEESAARAQALTSLDAPADATVVRPAPNVEAPATAAAGTTAAAAPAAVQPVIPAAQPSVQAPQPATAAQPAPTAPRRKNNVAKIAAAACVACALVVAGAWFVMADPADVFGHGPRAKAEQAAQEEADRQAREEQIRAEEREKAEQEAARKDAEEDAAEAAQAQREAEAKQKAAEQKQREAEAKQQAAEAEAAKLREAAAQRDAAIQRSAAGSSAFILPQSSSRVYSDSELNALTDEQLFYARNEIFARYGRKFKEAELDTYFRAQSWYRPTYDGETFDAMPDPLTDAEKENCKKMLAIEKARNSKYVQAPYV